ncbi:MAG: nucleoside deaminase [Candidatus Bilamarchaeaceae archaeon]
MERKFMLAAIKAAEKGVRRKDGGPFGACVVKGGKIISWAHNHVIRQNDPTAHAEIRAIRKACRKLGTWNLKGCEVYSTTEPCPMCFSAVHWARIRKIYFGARISDAKRYGLNELPITNHMLNRLGRAGITVKGDVMREECVRLFKEWRRGKGKKY